MIKKIEEEEKKIKDQQEGKSEASLTEEDD